ncbi:MAG: hypothetical protein JF564_01135 [Sphingomonas sp.]|jgi:hypothetical protein|nr:hypothetical protein [Sphingomonas sp.]
MIRYPLLAAALFSASQAHAGQDVPAPRPLRPLVSVIDSTPTGGWRETPAIMQGWSRDRHIAVAGPGRISACEARARISQMATGEDWADDSDDLAGIDADFEEDDGFAGWGI